MPSCQKTVLLVSETKIQLHAVCVILKICRFIKESKWQESSPQLGKHTTDTVSNGQPRTVFGISIVLCPLLFWTCVKGQIMYLALSVFGPNVSPGPMHAR
jgi:hypothetical protein